MNCGNVATCPTFSWGRGSICHIGRQGKRKRKSQTFDFFWFCRFWVPVTEEERKSQRNKKNKRRKKTQKIGEGKLENVEEAW